MNIILFGAAGFIGTNLTLQLMKNLNNEITLVDVNKNYFNNIYMGKNIRILESGFNMDTDFISLLKEQNVVYHLVSTTVPVTSNQHIIQEIIANVVVILKMLDACVECGVDKVVFVSSGGTVYGKEGICQFRDFIYIDDVVNGILKIENGKNEFCTFNLGCGYGTSINQVLTIIQQVLNKELNIIYKEGRKVDVPINYLDISRYEKIYGKLNPTSLEEGIYKTASFMREYFNI